MVFHNWIARGALIVASIVLLSPCPAAAQGVSEVSGTVSHGETLIISGNGFGGRDQAEPGCWEDFEGAGCEIDTTANDAAMYPPRQSNARAWSGNTALQCRLGTPEYDAETGERQGWGFYRFPREMQGGEKIFITFRERWSWGHIWCDEPEVTPASQVSYQVKNWRVSSGSSYTGLPSFTQNNQSDCNDHGGDAFRPRHYSEYRDPGNDRGDTFWFAEVDGSPTLPHGEWVQFEIMIQQSDTNQNNGQYHLWIGRAGGSDRVVSATGLLTHESGSESGFNKLSLGEWIDRGGRSAELYFDDLYFDYGWSRVVIGDAADYDACTVRDVQPYTNWSDGTIVVTANTASFVSGQDAHLFVIGDDGQPVGSIPVTIDSGGGSVDEGPPGQAQNVRRLQ